jgi:hypothetical protein
MELTVAGWIQWPRNFVSLDVENAVELALACGEDTTNCVARSVRANPLSGNFSEPSAFAAGKC